MPQTLPLLRGEEITYPAAKEKEANILHQLGYHAQQTRFFAHLRDRQDWITAIVAHHLGLSSAACHVATEENWIHGSCNVCIPIIIDGWNKKRVLIRFPLPYRIGEAFRPGNGDEKIRCEVGSYAWLQKHCPDVPIPSLYGFALSTGETFTRLENLPILSRYFELLRRQILSWLRYPIPSSYVRRPANHITLDKVIGAGYVLIEFIEETQGTMLSNTWFHRQDDARLRENFFRSLSRIFLSMTRIPLPKVGSFIIDKDGVLQLANRPLSIEIQQLENENIPTDISRDNTYCTVDSYIVDLLSAHDNRLKYQPNAVNGPGDCLYQLSALSAMRTVFPSLFRRSFRHGPFSFTLTDLSQSNLFVDAEWNITCLVDLEWACSQPIEMLSPPYWLTNKSVDQMVSTEYNAIRTEFMEILAEEERTLRTKSRLIGNSNVLPYSLSEVMNRTWETGTFWYTLALSSPSGLCRIFHNQIRVLFCPDHHQELNLIMPFFWGRNLRETVDLKTSDKTKYDEDLRQAFGDS